MFVLDSHCDTPSQIQRLRDVGVRGDRGHVDFPRMKEGRVDAAFFALYVSPSFVGDAATAQAFKLLSGIMDSLDANPGMAKLALSPDDALDNKEKGLASVFLGLENGSPIQDSLSLLREFYRLGVRYMTLCHSADNQICDSCASPSGTWGGLSPFGREVVREMNRLGMIVDVSHISDRSFYDVLECSDAPVVASHSSARALADHPRNMSDDMIKALAAKGGVIQINFYPVFLDSSFSAVLSASGIMERGEAIEAAFIADASDPEKRKAWYGIQDELSALKRPSYKRIVDHIDHVVSLVGIDYVGLGSDFDGIEVTPEGLEDVSKFYLIFEEMRKRGYSESEISKVAGENFLSVFRKIIRTA